LVSGKKRRWGKHNCIEPLRSFFFRALNKSGPVFFCLFIIYTLGFQCPFYRQKNCICQTSPILLLHLDFPYTPLTRDNTLRKEGQGLYIFFSFFNSLYWIHQTLYTVHPSIFISSPLTAPPHLLLGCVQDVASNNCALVHLVVHHLQFRQPNDLVWSLDQATAEEFNRL